MDDAYSDALLAQLRRKSRLGAFANMNDFYSRSSSMGGTSLDRSETLPSKQLRDEVGRTAPHLFSEYPEYAPEVQAILETKLPSVEKISKIAAEILRTDGFPFPNVEKSENASTEDASLPEDGPESAPEDLEPAKIDPPLSQEIPEEDEEETEVERTDETSNHGSVEETHKPQQKPALAQDASEIEVEEEPPDEAQDVIDGILQDNTNEEVHVREQGLSPVEEIAEKEAEAELEEEFQIIEHEGRGEDIDEESQDVTQSTSLDQQSISKLPASDQESFQEKDHVLEPEPPAELGSTADKGLAPREESISEPEPNLQPESTLEPESIAEQESHQELETISEQDLTASKPTAGPDSVPQDGSMTKHDSPVELELTTEHSLNPELEPIAKPYLDLQHASAAESASLVEPLINLEQRIKELESMAQLSEDQEIIGELAAEPESKTAELESNAEPAVEPKSIEEPATEAESIEAPIEELRSVNTELESAVEPAAAPESVEELATEPESVAEPAMEPESSNTELESTAKLPQSFEEPATEPEPTTEKSGITTELEIEPESATGGPKPIAEPESISEHESTAEEPESVAEQGVASEHETASRDLGSIPDTKSTPEQDLENDQKAASMSVSDRDSVVSQEPAPTSASEDSFPAQEKPMFDEPFDLEMEAERMGDYFDSHLEMPESPLANRTRTPDRRPVPIRTSSSRTSTSRTSTSDRKPTHMRTPSSARSVRSERTPNSSRSRPTPDRRRTIDTPPRPPITPKAWVSRASFAGETISSMLKKRDSNASLNSPSSAHVRSPSSASILSYGSALSRAPSSASFRSTATNTPSKIPSRPSSRASFITSPRTPQTPQTPSRIPSRTSSVASLGSSVTSLPTTHARTPSSASVTLHSRTPSSAPMSMSMGFGTGMHPRRTPSITSLISPTAFAESPSRPSSRIPVMTPIKPAIARATTTPNAASTSASARPRLSLSARSSRTGAKSEK